MSDRGLSFLIHGGARSGKSTVAATAPYPRLVLDVENSAKFLTSNVKIWWDPMTQEPPVADGTWDTCVVAITDFDIALKAYEWLKSGRHQFRSVILDSISELQVKAKELVSNRRALKTQDWGELLSLMGYFGRDLRDLTSGHTSIEAVVVIAQTIEKDDVYKPYLQGQFATQLPYLYDIASYLYVDQEQDQAGNITQVRRLLTERHPNFEAGSRVPGLDPIITNPNIEQIILSVFGPRPEVTQ